MQDKARKLLVVLAERGKTAASEVGLSEADLAQAVAELSGFVDDDNQQVHVVQTWNSGGKITAIELTEHGRGLAVHARA